MFKKIKTAIGCVVQREKNTQPWQDLSLESGDMG